MFCFFLFFCTTKTSYGSPRGSIKPLVRMIKNVETYLYINCYISLKALKLNHLCILHHYNNTIWVRSLFIVANCVTSILLYELGIRINNNERCCVTKIKQHECITKSCFARWFKQTYQHQFSPHKELCFNVLALAFKHFFKFCHLFFAGAIHKCSEKNFC